MSKLLFGLLIVFLCLSIVSTNGYRKRSVVEYQKLEGSSRPVVAGAVLSSTAINPQEIVDVTILVRRNNIDQFNNHLRLISIGQERHLTIAEFEARYGSTADDMKAVTAFAASFGLTVVQQHSGRRTMIVSGSVENVNRAFGVELMLFEGPSGQYRGFIGEAAIPSSLVGIIDDVLGLDNRPVASPRIRFPKSAEPLASYNPLQVGAMYEFPKGTGGAKANIAIIELGGGFRQTDLDTYFANIGVTSPPTVVAVSVDGAKNSPSTANSADAEVMLDIEVSGSLATSSAIVVYFGPNSDAGFLDAITTAAHDATYNPSVISISWGDEEGNWAVRTLNSYDSAFAAGAILGVSSFAASGDDGSSDGGSGNNVDFPAASPHVTGCGGTTLTGSGGRITSETAWSGTGGGVSAHFALPEWQTGLNTTTNRGVKAALKMRGVPDIASVADPETGYVIRIDGANYIVGGTSAAAPLWAALTAINGASSNSRYGLLNDVLYAKPQPSLRDITSGTNGAWSAAAGWDATTGYGSPNATVF